MRRLLFSSVLLVVFAGCSDENGGTDGGTRDGSSTGTDSGTGGMDSGTPGVDGGADGGITILPDGRVIGPAAVAPCQGHIYLCGNTLDDDGDGLADSEDPDCLGPCDNNEGGFYLNIPGGDSSPCQLDCYFDQDQGPGNDGCEWDARCDPLEPDPNPLCAYEDPPRPPTVCPDTQDPECEVNCGPLVPNGCDCFGCCELPSGSGEYRFIGSVADDGTTPTCSLSNLEGCRPCTPVDACLNACGRCELCLGRTFEDLPDDCFGTPPPDAGTLPDGGPAPTPDGGTPIDVCSDPTRQDCGVPGLPACPDGFFCVTGCCTFFG